MANHASHPAQESVIEGYLFSKGYFGDWVNRYVELHGDVVVYRFVKGGMKLGSFRITARSKCEDNSDRHFCLLLSDPISKDRLYLAAINSSTKEAWSEAIHNILTGLRFAERKMKYGDQHNRLVMADDRREQHKIYVRIIQARNLLAKDADGCSDPYVKVTMGSATARTTTRKKNLNPDWGMVFPFSWDESMRFVRVEVWADDQKAADHFLGMVMIPIYSLRDGATHTAWYPLGKRSTRSTVGGDIEVELASSGMPDRASRAWRLFYQVQQLPDMTLNFAARADGNGQIALDFDGIRLSRKDHHGQNRCLIGDTDSVSSDEDEEAPVGLPSGEDGDDNEHMPTTYAASSVLHGFPLCFPPIELEQLEDLSLHVHLKCAVGTAKLSCPGMLMLTNYRLIFLPNTRLAPACHSELQSPGPGGGGGYGTVARTQSDVMSRTSAPTQANGQLTRREVDLSTQIPIASIIDVTFTTDTEDSGPYVGSNFESIKVTTTDCRVLVFQFVEDADTLGQKHAHFISKILGTPLPEGVRPIGNGFGRSLTADSLSTRDTAPLRGSESDLRARSPVPGGAARSPNDSNGVPPPWPGLAPSKLEKCWLRLVRESVPVVEGLDSEEGTPGQRFQSRIKNRVINRASEKSTAINTNMALLHTLRTACGLNPSAPQYFFHSIGEYDAVMVHATRQHSATDAPSVLPLGWSATDKHDASTGPSKTERLREDCTLAAVVQKIGRMEPLHNVYTKLLHNIENSWLMYDPHNEFKRMGIPNSNWRISYANVQYELCETYPAVLAFPKTVDDETLVAAAPFRSKQRLPALSWRSTVNNATISRSSQPMVGLGMSRNAADEFLLREIGKASVSSSDDLTLSFANVRPTPSVDFGSGVLSGLQMSDKSNSTAVLSAIPLVQGSSRRYVITDARPLLNARANQAAGKGVESDKNYENCSVVFLDIANIHSMRKSLELMIDANCADDNNWMRNAESAGWLGHIRKVLLGASKIAHFLAYEGLSVLVHCSDGWDRTSQLTSLSMLMMDGYYRTLKGFIVLIEKEWLSFGHKFGDRQGWTNEGFVDEERSPIFAQFLDCVHQFLVQMPDAFEFNQDLLLFLVTHLYSGWFGNFLFNSEYEMKFHVSHKSLLSIWTVVLGNKEKFRNPNYGPRESPVVPVVSKSKLVIWNGWFLSWYDKVWSAAWKETNQLELKADARVIDGKMCFKCEAVFTFTRRKHHCRCCGQIFCYDCCHARRIVPSVSTAYKVRCCNECALLLDMDYFTTENVGHERHAFGGNVRASFSYKA